MENKVKKYGYIKFYFVQQGKGGIVREVIFKGIRQ